MAAGRLRAEMDGLGLQAEKGGLRLLAGKDGLAESLLQAGKFGLVGFSNTLVDALVYVILANAILALPVAVAKAISYLAGMANSYFWNRRWTFRSSLALSKTLLPFIAANLAGMALNVAAMQIALHLLRLDEGPAFALATGAAVTWNFLINKLFVFKTPTGIGERNLLPTRRA